MATKINKFNYKTYDKLKLKTDRPSFDFVVLISEDGLDRDYYLFRWDEFEDAYNILKQEAIKDADSYSSLCEIDFNTYNREYRLKPTFSIRDGKIIYDKYNDNLLHVVWYMKAGNWLNPRDDI